MKTASIDIGSNTVILLLAEIVNKKIISEENIFRIGKLGQNLLPGSEISSEKTQRLFSILDEFYKIIREEKCDTIHITATNALRIASNGEEIAESIFKKYGTRVDIITGDVEAGYSFIGATYNYSKPSHSNVVVDIGGGSTEIIIGSKEKLLFKNSFQIGTVSLTDKFISASKPVVDEIVQMQKFANKVFERLEKFSQIELTAIGVGGTPTSLSGMIRNIYKYDESKIEGKIINREEIDLLSNKISKMTAIEILERYKEMVIGRNEFIFAGSLILKILLEKLNLNELIVSSKGLRYGVIYSKYLL